MLRFVWKRSMVPWENQVSDFLYVDSIVAFSARRNLEWYFITLINRLVDEAGYVYENFFAGFVFLDETVAFGGVKKFDYSCFHWRNG